MSTWTAFIIGFIIVSSSSSSSSSSSADPSGPAVWGEGLLAGVAGSNPAGGMDVCLL